MIQYLIDSLQYLIDSLQYLNDPFQYIGNVMELSIQNPNFSKQCLVFIIIYVWNGLGYPKIQIYHLRVKRVGR